MWMPRADRFIAATQAPEGALDAAAWVLAFQGRALVRDPRGGVPTLGALEGALAQVQSVRAATGLGRTGMHYLGRHIEGPVSAHCFAIRLSAAQTLPPGWTAADLRTLYHARFEPIGLPRRAITVLDWNDDHQFCGRCGAPTTPEDAERKRICPACDFVVFPRISPAVIVAVRRGDTLLMGRSSPDPAGRYSVLAGFIEGGESAEEAIAREVHEEVGVRVTDIEYFGSQSWPHPNALMLGYRARYLDGDICVDGCEIRHAGWFHYDALPPRRQGTYSIAQWLIEDFIASAKTVRSQR